MQAHCIKGLGFPTAGSAGRVREDQTASRREPDPPGNDNAGSERSKLRNANFGGTHHRSEAMNALRSSVREALPRGSANQRPITIARGPHCRRAGFARDPPPCCCCRSLTSRRPRSRSARGRTREPRHQPDHAERHHRHRPRQSDSRSRSRSGHHEPRGGALRRRDTPCRPGPPQAPAPASSTC